MLYCKKPNLFNNEKFMALPTPPFGRPISFSFQEYQASGRAQVRNEGTIGLSNAKHLDTHKVHRYKACHA
jgi:ABC-type thiamine transport system ATPase subunit